MILMDDGGHPFPIDVDGQGQGHTSDICEQLNQAQIGPSNLDYSAISAYVLSIM